ncbi:MAG: hypothetical protein NTV34_05760 [Proteobacteria bacterium]|nr:hypothetical protein [Pseudomonadota bacterium]
MNFDVANITNFVDRIRLWPWRKVALVTTVSFVLASSVSTLIGYFMMGQTERFAPEAPPSDSGTGWSKSPTLSQPQLDKILERNIFNSEGGIGDVAQTGSSVDKIPKSTLPIKVVGIIYGGDPESGLAMVEHIEKHTVNSFLVGDPLTPEALLKEVQLDRILIDNQGRLEYAQLEESEIRRSSRKGKKTGRGSGGPSKDTGSGLMTDAPPDNYKEEGFERKGGLIEMTQEYKNRLLTVDFANVLQDAKASPNMVDGSLRGWRLDRILEEINGVILSDAGQAIKTLQGLRNESEIDIRLNRNGKPTNVNFKVR